MKPTRPTAAYPAAKKHTASNTCAETLNQPAKRLNRNLNSAARCGAAAPARSGKAAAVAGPSPGRRLDRTFRGAAARRARQDQRAGLRLGRRRLRGRTLGGGTGTLLGIRPATRLHFGPCLLDTAHVFGPFLLGLATLLLDSTRLFLPLLFGQAALFLGLHELVELALVLAHLTLGPQPASMDRPFAGIGLEGFDTLDLARQRPGRHGV